LGFNKRTESQWNGNTKRTPTPKLKLRPMILKKDLGDIKIKKLKIIRLSILLMIKMEKGLKGN
jgi:hypothetical protein